MLTTTEDAFIINNDNESWDGGSTEIMDVYRDFAGIPDDTAVESGDVESILLSKYQPSFPVRLQHMLGQLEEEGYEDIASWEIHGR